MSVELEYDLVHRISQYLSFIDSPLTILKEYEINITVPKSSVDVYRTNSYQGRAWLVAVQGIVASLYDQRTYNYYLKPFAFNRETNGFFLWFFNNFEQNLKLKE
ncbi:hypothetical protein J7E66_14750 [Bacillus sp. ISL-7]|nr:hypothetical protein [Bacillus sp. ISL-7]